MKKILLIALLLPIFLMGQDFLTVTRYANSKYVELDGVDEYLSTSYQTSEYNNAITMSAWFKFSDEGEWHDILAEMEYSVAGYRISIRYTKIMVQSFTPSSSVYYSEGYDFNNGEWYFISIYLSADSCGAYVNGFLENSISGETFIDVVSTKIVVGKSLSNMNGAIDEVALFSGVLTKEQMDYLYGGGTPQTCGDARKIEGLKNYFTMQDIIGATVPNKAPNGGVAGDATMFNMESEDIKTFDNIQTNYFFLTAPNGDFITK